MGAGEAAGEVAVELPPLSAETYESVLDADTQLQVVDVLNVGQSREAQLAALARRLQPAAAQTVTEISEDDEGPAAARDAARDATRDAGAHVHKYTVKDARGALAFLVFLDAQPPRLRLGARIVVQRGTRVWRSVLTPRGAEVRQLDAGVAVSLEAQRARLEQQPEPRGPAA